jgi:hypothetical protein
VTRSSEVRAVMAAAERVARDPAIVAPLVASTGLSRQGVELALARHLERRATDAEIASLVASSGKAESVHVILSSSVFVAPLRAIATALAASDRVTVKPSRREPVFATALVGALADPRVVLAPALDVASVASGEIHVYGRDETIAEVRRAAGPGVIVRGHGAGMGVALVTGDLTRAAAALAEDVIAFDQRGCLSPRVAFVVDDATAFGRALFDALEARGRDVPRGALDPSESEEAARWASTVAYAGALHSGASCAVGVLGARAIPPSGRHVLVRPLASASDFLRVLGDDARFVTTVGSDLALNALRAIAPKHARLSALGAMQRPPLDGPVDLRP